MPQLIVTPTAVAGIERCLRFLAAKTPQASRRALQTIRKHIESLKTMPDVGRHVAEFPGQRELLIDFGDSGYVARYRFVPEQNTVYILAFRHPKESGR